MKLKQCVKSKVPRRRPSPSVYFRRGCSFPALRASIRHLGLSRQIRQEAQDLVHSQKEIIYLIFNGGKEWRKDVLDRLTDDGFPFYNLPNNPTDRPPPFFSTLAANAFYPHPIYNIPVSKFSDSELEYQNRCTVGPGSNTRISQISLL